MSRQRFKITLRYDSNCGPTDEQIIYCIQNNSTDYRYFFDENGEFIECYGTDSYCDYLGYALRLEEYIENKPTCYNDKEWWGCKIDEIGWSELPDKVKETYDK